MPTEDRKATIPWHPWLVGLGIGLFLLFFFWSFRFVAPSSETHRIQVCQSNLKQIGLALHNYATLCNRFPPAYVMDEKETPLYSWRVLMLPFLEEENLWKQFHRDESWDSPHNKALLATPNVPCYTSFRCPSSKVSFDWDKTTYVLVTGPGTIWDGDTPCSLKDIPHPEQTLMLIEVAAPNLHWAEPKDFNIAAIDPCFLDEQGNFKTNHRNFIHAAFADGHIEKIPKGKILFAIQNRSQVK